MKILLFHMRFHPDPTGTAPLVSQLAEDLAAAGNQVDVVASLPHYGRSDVHPDYRDHRGLFHISEYRGARIWRTPVYVPPSPRIFHRALNYLSYTFLSVVAGFRVGKVDIVLAINPPITTTFSAWLIALVRRIPLVVGIQDIWPDCVILVGQLKNQILVRISRWMERLQYRIACKIVVLSQGMKENLVAKQVPEQKIISISNWADSDALMPLPKENSFSREYNLEDRNVVLFAGNHGFNAALESVVDAAELIQHISDAEFLLVGEGNVKNQLFRQAKNAQLSNVRFLSTQPEGKYPEVLAAADIGLVTLRKNLGALSLPSKVYTLMAAARPILAAVPSNSGIRSLVEDADCGICVPPEDPRALADAVQTLLDQKDKLAQMGRNGRAYLEQHFTRRIQTDQYHKLLNDLACRGSTK